MVQNNFKTTKKIKYQLNPSLKAVSLFFYVYIHICNALRDLLPFVQFKKREGHPWRNVTFSKVAG